MNINLELIKSRLLQLQTEIDCSIDYWVPDLTKPEREINLNPFDFFSERISKIDELSRKINSVLPAKDWTKDAVVYNMLIRYTTAYDHDRNGIIYISPNEYGLMETGTFLKTIALLPYLHELGVNTIHLLPITSIGFESHKGNLGSPYAIKNPYQLDERLSEPFLEMSSEVQFGALVEAAHSLGMKVVLEFVFRTASPDSELALQHPEWFYWIKANIPNKSKSTTDEITYSAPKFTEEELEEIEIKINAQDFKDLIPPPKEYIDMFTEIPEKIYFRDGRIMVETKDGKECRIPSAFADWPPNDTQPPWSDVTYLRLFDHPDFNYIAYNTVRMYDDLLNQKENIVQSLWDNIAGIIPYYIKNFGIDGVLLDMGHALPAELRKQISSEAKKVNPNFVFWEENFTLSKKSVEDGYSAVVGYVPFDEHVHWKLKLLINMLSKGESPISFFLTPETHNTPRAAFRKGGIAFSKFCWALNCFLPGVLFIHSGFELGERVPVNTGLDFTDEEIDMFPSDYLPLFSSAAMNWKSGDDLTAFMKQIMQIRTDFLTNNPQKFNKEFTLLECENEFFLAFFHQSKLKNVVFIGNMNHEYEIESEIQIPEDFTRLVDIITQRSYSANDNKIRINLKPFEFIVGKFL